LEIQAVNVSPPPPALRTVVPPGYRLRLPGPAAVPERVRAALALPVLNHRGPEFHAVLAEAASGLRRIFGTRRDVFLFGASAPVIRFGTMGWVDAGDILTDLHHLECTLRDLGHAPPAGAGVTAAARVQAQ
jgi:aspartate aminotransferase-like enzyme